MNQLATIPQTQELSADTIERALIVQDLSGMKPAERLNYYRAVCDSLGLNPLTRPFAYITLNNKLTLYALKDCTEQLRNIHGVSIEIVSRDSTEGVYVVTARATNKHGRKDESIGAVAFENLRGDAKANAIMKCETKAKRRVTLSICGLGMLDETEIETIPGVVQEREEISEWQRAKEISADGCKSKEDQRLLHRVSLEMREHASKYLNGQAQAMLLGEAGDLQAAADDYCEEQAAESVNTEVEKRAQSRGETNEVNADNWQSVVCHVGKSGGPYVEKDTGRHLTVGEICGPKVKTTRAQKLLEWLETNWLAEAAPKIEALGPRANTDDRRLALALGFARTAFDARTKAETPPEPEKPEIQPPSAKEEASEPDPTAPLPEKSAKPKRQQIQWREAAFPYEAKIKGTKLGELMPVAETLGISPVKAFQLIAKQFLLDPERTKGADPKLDKQFRACYAAGEADLCLGEPKSTIVKHLLEMSSDLALSQDFMCQSCEECGLFHAPETRSNQDRRFADYTDDELRLLIYRWPEAEATFKADFARVGKP